MKKTKTVLLFGIMALFLGFVTGGIIWILLKIINALTDLVWWCGSGNILYNLAVCLVGGVLIGLWQKKHGILPHDTEQVIEITKKDGRYPYNNLGVIAVAAILPLVFGAAIGPEAGLTGIIVGLCYWVGDSLKTRGDKLAKYFGDVSDCSSEAIAEAGISVMFGIVFGAPFAGIIGNLEESENLGKTRKRLLEKKGRIFLYCLVAIGAVLAFFLLGKLLGAIANLTGNAKFIEFALGGGLPRFDKAGGLFGSFEVSKLIYFIPLIIAGMILALIYKGFDKITKFLSEKIVKYRVVSCLIAGACVAVCGFALPDTMFSGEHTLGTLIDTWQSADALILILTCLVKLLLTCICINFGWRGGSIFPIIFCGTSMAFGLSLLIGGNLDGAFAAAVLLSAMYAFISKKPLMAVAILLLCFPITYIIPMLIAAIPSAKVSAALDKLATNKN